MDEYQEVVRAAFAERIEVGTMPAPGEGTYVLVGYTLSNGYKACFALTTLEARRLALGLAMTADEVADGV